jgi:hypothetical protein
MRATLSGGTADAFVTEGDLNIAADGVGHIKFDIWFSPTFDATADDTVHLYEAQGAANAIQAVVGFRYVAATDVINFGIGELAPTSFGAEPIKRGVWYTLEAVIELDDGASNDGTIDLYVTEIGQRASTTVHCTQVASLDQIAVTHGVLGVQNHLATTTGVILFDHFVADDARIYPRTELFPYTKLLTKSDNVFIGAGYIIQADLLSGAATNNVLTIYDTDEAIVTDASNILLELKNTVNNEVVSPADIPKGGYHCHRGCSVVITGTNPRALVKIDRAPAYGSYAAIRNHGLKARSV